MEFLGMALYNKEEIKKALDNYNEVISNAKSIKAKAIAKAEEEWKPSWWDKLRRTKSLHKKYKQADTYHYYSAWLYRKEYLDKESKDIQLLVSLSNWSIYLDRWSDEYHQVKNLFNGGKDCYLNPSQAKFVNNFKGGYD